MFAEADTKCITAYLLKRFCLQKTYINILSDFLLSISASHKKITDFLPNNFFRYICNNTPTTDAVCNYISNFSTKESNLQNVQRFTTPRISTGLS